MFLTCKEIKNKLKDGISLNKCISLWTDGLEELVQYIIDKDNEDADGDSDSDSDNDSNDDELINLDNVDFLTKNITLSLNLFNKDRILKHKNCDKILFSLSKIISWHLFVGRIEIVIEENILIKLLDFIDWDCSLLLQHAEDWATSEEDAGCDIVKIMELAATYDRNITGFADDRVVYSLLMAVQHCENDNAENFIIDNDIKLSKHLSKSNDGLISDMIEYFNREREYNLLPKKLKK